MRFALFFFTSVIAWSMLSGCASVPADGYQADGRYCSKISKRNVCTTKPIPSPQQESTAKQFEADPTRQIVWVVRNARFDAYGRVLVSVNGLQIDMLPNTVSRFVLVPGRHDMAAMHRSSEAGKIAIEGKAGEQVFVEVHADVGIFATHFSLRELPDGEGRRKALTSKLIADQRTGTSP